MRPNEDSPLGKPMTHTPNSWCIWKYSSFRTWN